MLLQRLINFAAAGDTCTLDKDVFGIPTWYKYLDGQVDPITKKCQLLFEFHTDKFATFVGVGIALVEILLFFAGIVSVIYIIYGGFRYLLSQGNPENTKVAKDAIMNALIGLAIALIASTLVRFIGKRIS